tara:strand:- start:488 stop:658 length:171 start_codon:yes stop_codon:yes gene_type:complete
LYGLDDKVTPAVQEVIGRFLARHFPEANTETGRHWASIHGMTPDSLPIISRLLNEP